VQGPAQIQLRSTPVPLTSKIGDKKTAPPDLGHDFIINSVGVFVSIYPDWFVASFCYSWLHYRLPHRVWLGANDIATNPF